MAILIFVLSFILLIGAAASGYQSLDLLPTGIGVLYALTATVAACAAVITFALGVAIRRIDVLTSLMRRPTEPFEAPETAASDETMAADTGFRVSHTGGAADPAIGAAGPGSPDEAFAGEDESPININRAGHLPSLETVETTLETPEEPKGPPSLIGSYSSAGANYKIFDDGSIEAETGDGTFTFASMTDFKRHLIERGKTQSAPSGE